MGALVFGERDHLADVGRSKKKHDQAVKAERDAAVRRGAITERVQQKAELRLRLFFTNAQRLKRALLHIAPVNPNAAPAQFNAVEDQIIRLRFDLQRIGLKKIHMLRERRGKGMVAGGGVALVVFFKQRPVGHPQKVVLLGVEQFQLLAQMQPQMRQAGVDDFGFIRHKEQDVAHFRIETFNHRVLNAFVEELHDVGFEAVFFVLHPCQTLGPVDARFAGEVFDVFTAERCPAFDANAANFAALIGDGFEYREIAVFHDIGEFFQFHREAGIGTVGAEAAHGFVIGHPREGRFDPDSLHFLPDTGHQAFHNLINIIGGDERHLHINLGEFRLAVGALVFIAEAFDDLDIAVKPGNHAELFVNLRRLRQREELARADPAGDQKVARAFGSGFTEDGRFDLNKILRMKVVAHHVIALAAEDNVVAQ